MIQKGLFYAKILLFGEYGIIENAKGLTIPFSDYKGILKFDNQSISAKKSNSYLCDFVQYIQQKIITKDLPEFNMEQLEVDIKKGLYFDSDIPQGYGIGSSGALVAAIYDRYAINKIDIDKINKAKIRQLKNIFSVLESHFHGTSSGIDPLICYLNIPLLIHSKNDISTIGLPNSQGKGAIFLLNSGLPGETEPMVKIFFEKLKNNGFRKTLKEEFIKYNDACIEAFIKGEQKPLFHNLKELSGWALQHLKPMIPQSILTIWEEGLRTHDYYLKLCGSGGGGYILGFTLDYDKIASRLTKFNPEIVHRF